MPRKPIDLVAGAWNIPSPLKSQDIDFSQKFYQYIVVLRINLCYCIDREGQFERVESRNATIGRTNESIMDAERCIKLHIALSMCQTQAAGEGRLQLPRVDLGSCLS